MQDYHQGVESNIFVKLQDPITARESLQDLGIVVVDWLQWKLRTLP